MMSETMRVYDAGRFHDVALPDWYREARRIARDERIDWRFALERTLRCDRTWLTSEEAPGGRLEIVVWQSPTEGIFVLLEAPDNIVDQVVVLNPTDWLPFLSTYLAPLVAAATQRAALTVQAKIATAIVAWARHGEGDHVDRETGLSRIDLDHDRGRRRARPAHAAAARADQEARS